MANEFSESKNPRQIAQEVYNNTSLMLGEVVGILSPENPDLDLATALPSAGELRAEGGEMLINPEQEAGLRSLMAERLGVGKSYDLSLSELGLIGSTVFIEGGQPHKMLAEAELVLEDAGSSKPKTLVFGGSPFRKITNPDEIKSAERLLGSAEATEYVMAKKVAASLPGFRGLEEEKILPSSYDIKNGYKPGQEETGQLVQIGEIAGVPVVMFRIDREDYLDDNGKKKYRNQPGTAEVIDLVAGFINDGSSIAFITSSTYPSRAIDAIRAGLSSSRVVGVATYGNDRLARIKGDENEAQPPTPINQLVGEIHHLNRCVKNLGAELNK